MVLNRNVQLRKTMRIGKIRNRPSASRGVRGGGITITALIEGGLLYALLESVFCNHFLKLP